MRPRTPPPGLVTWLPDFRHNPATMANQPGTAAQLVMRCFHARTGAHMLHLQTTSYAEHKALEEFYLEIVELTDKFAETYQGTYSVLDKYPTAGFEIADDAETLVNELEQWITEHRDEIGDDDDTHLQNIIDEIVALARSTRYKLRTFL